VGCRPASATAWPASGNRGLALECGLPALDCLVRDPLLAALYGCDGEVGDQSEDARCDAIRDLENPAQCVWCQHGRVAKWDVAQDRADQSFKLLVRRPAEYVGLKELRKARRLSQAALAARLHTDQAGVSKLEKRADLALSTLKGYVEAAGGSLEIVARFPDGPALRIDRLGDVGRPKKADAA
jgi:predicted XRE-type DNA-binding protein